MRKLIIGVILASAAVLVFGYRDAHAQGVYEGLGGRIDLIDPNAVVKVLPGFIPQIAPDQLFQLPPTAVKRRFEGRLEIPMVINSTPRQVARVNPQGRLYCVRPEEPNAPFNNEGTIKAVVAYPLPAPMPGCQGLQCLLNWPTVSITKNGVPYNHTAVNMDTNGINYSFNVKIVPTDTVDLIISHGYGTASVNPNLGHKVGLVADMNCP